MCSTIDSVPAPLTASGFARLVAHAREVTAAVAASMAAEPTLLAELPDGSRAVVSHFNKATKGRLLRHWLTTGADPRDADDLADACASMGVVVELGERPKAGTARRLDVVVTDL